MLEVNGWVQWHFIKNFTGQYKTNHHNKFKISEAIPIRTFTQISFERFNEENKYIRYRTIHRNTDRKKYITSAQGMASSSAEMRAFSKSDMVFWHPMTGRARNS